MKRDMDLIRKIMFAIEEEYSGEAIQPLRIEGYDKTTIALHCKLLYEYGLVDHYKPIGADDIPIITFYVGNLTWEGYDFLEKVRQDTVWNKTKDTIVKNGLPMVIDVVKQVAQSVVVSMTEGAIKGMLNQ